MSRKEPFSVPGEPKSTFVPIVNFQEGAPSETGF